MSALFYEAVQLQSWGLLFSRRTFLSDSFVVGFNETPNNELNFDIVRQALHAEVGKDGACGNDQSELADPDQRIIGIVGNGRYVGI